MNAQNDVLISDYPVGTYLFGVTSTATSLLLLRPTSFYNCLWGACVGTTKRNKRIVSQAFKAHLKNLQMTKYTYMQEEPIRIKELDQCA